MSDGPSTIVLRVLMRIGVRPSLEKVHIPSLVQTPKNLPGTFLGSKGEPPYRKTQALNGRFSIR